MPEAAYIFDMDDTLVATSPMWRRAEEALLRALGEEWSADLAQRYKGMNALDVASVIHDHVQPALSRLECQQILRNVLIQEFCSGCIRAMHGAVELVRQLHGQAPLAVASGSPLVCIESAMESLGIRQCFDALLTSELVSRGKPHPDIFLVAARKLNVEPSDCVVFEDSLIGTQAGKAAGMQVICVPSGQHRQEIAQLADVILPTLADALPHPIISSEAAE